MFTGSRAFFEGLEGFCPHDTDIMQFVEGQKHLLVMFNNKEGESVFSWRDDVAVVEHILTQTVCPTYIAALLVPEFVSHFGIGVEEWKRAKSLAAKLDRKHVYLGMILDFYIENGKAELTDEQRLAAFENYKEARKK